VAAAFQVHLASFYLKSQLQSSEREPASDSSSPQSAQRLPPSATSEKKRFSRLLLLFLTHVSFSPANLISRQPFLVAATHTPFFAASNSPRPQLEPPDRSAHFSSSNAPFQAAK
jgi:hypothetical protein